MIAAAGSGQRLGAGGPKAFVEVGGRPLIEWSLQAFAAAGSVDRIVVVAPSGVDFGSEGVDVVAGGATRAESVRNGVGEARGEVVVVHDAARPLVTGSLIDRIVERLLRSEAEGVIAAAPVADTLKRAGEADRIAATVDRAGLWGAQTPQAFRTASLRSAQEAAASAGELESATDEAWLIERAGGTVLLEDPGAPNLKVTNAADLAVAEALLT